MERIIFVPGKRVSLVIPERQDFDIMYKSANNVNITRFWWPVKHQTKETEDQYINNVLNWGKKLFMIMLNDTKEIIGSVWMHEYSDINRNWVIWITLYNELQMWKWYGTEAMNLFLKYAFEYIGSNKVKLQVYSNNPRAKKSYEKCWFREVWVFREDLYIMWEYVDSIAMEMLKNEWEILKK